MAKMRGGKVRRGGRRKQLVHRNQKSNRRRESGTACEVDRPKETRDGDRGERMTTARSGDDDEAVGGDKSATHEAEAVIGKVQSTPEEDEVVADGGGIETAAKEVDSTVCEDATTAKADEIAVPIPRCSGDDNIETTTKNNENSSQAIGDKNNLEERAYNVWLEESDPDDVDFVVETEDVENGEVKDKDIEEEFVTQRAKKGKRKRKKKKSGKRNTMSDSVDSSSNSDEDEEDLVERFQFEVEEDVAMFVDEFSRGRREIPESDAEDEDPMVERSRRIRRGSGEKLVVGRCLVSV